MCDSVLLSREVIMNRVTFLCLPALSFHSFFLSPFSPFLSFSFTSFVLAPFLPFFYFLSSWSFSLSPSLYFPSTCLFLLLPLLCLSLHPSLLPFPSLCLCPAIFPAPSFSCLYHFFPPPPFTLLVLIFPALTSFPPPPPTDCREQDFLPEQLQDEDFSHHRCLPHDLRYNGIPRQPHVSHPFFYPYLFHHFMSVIIMSIRTPLLENLANPFQTFPFLGTALCTFLIYKLIFLPLSCLLHCNDRYICEIKWEYWCKMDDDPFSLISQFSLKFCISIYFPSFLWLKIPLSPW